MNKQSKRLLMKFADIKKIYNANDINLKALAIEFGVSVRSIRNYIDLANVFLKKHGLQMLSIAENGVILNFNNPIILHKSLEKFNLYNYRLSKNERKKIISLILLLNDKYITFSDISETLFFSRVTIINDVNSLKKEIFNDEIRIKSKPNKGLYIDCNEATRRNKALELLTSDSNYLAMINVLNIYLDKYEDEIYLNDIFKEIIEEIEQKYQFILNETSHNLVLSYMYILLIRYKNFDSSMIESLVMEGEDYLMHKNLLTKISNDLIALMLRYFKIDFGNIDYEIEFLSNVLSYCNYSNTSKNRNVIEVQMITKKFIKQISDVLQYNLVNDFEFYKNLSNHIDSIMKESVLKLDMDVMLVFQDILENHASIVEKIKSKINVIEEFFNRKLEDVELYYIVIHVIAAIERKSISKINLNVVLLCNFGIGTSQLIKARINRHFEFSFLRSMSLEQFLETNLDLDNIDLIISTIDFDRLQSDWNYIKISPILSDTDVVMIQNKVIELQNQKYSINSETQQFQKKSHNMINCKSIENNIDTLTTVIEKSIKKKLSQIKEDKYITLEDAEVALHDVLFNSIKTDLDSYLKSDLLKTKDDISINKETNIEDQAKLSDLLTDEYIELDIKVKNLEEGIRTCGELLHRNGDITEEYIDAMVENIRENGDYVLISEKFILPHADIDRGSKNTAMALIRLEREVDFDISSKTKIKKEDINFKKVRYICALSAIDKHSHLKSLFSLINLLSNPHFKNILNLAEDKNEIIDFIKKYEDSGEYKGI